MALQPSPGQHVKHWSTALQSWSTAMSAQRRNRHKLSHRPASSSIDCQLIASSKHTGQQALQAGRRQLTVVAGLVLQARRQCCQLAAKSNMPWPEQSERTAKGTCQLPPARAADADHEDAHLQECQSELHSHKLAHPSPHGSCQHCHSRSPAGPGRQTSQLRRWAALHTRADLCSHGQIVQRNPLAELQSTP